MHGAEPRNRLADHLTSGDVRRLPEYRQLLLGDMIVLPWPDRRLVGYITNVITAEEWW
jgi:hypothetical protein